MYCISWYIDSLLVTSDSPITTTRWQCQQHAAVNHAHLPPSGGDSVLTIFSAENWSPSPRHLMAFTKNAVKISWQIRRCQTMLAPIGKHTQLKRDAFRKRQPVQITEQWRDVVVLTTRTHESSSSVEYRRKLKCAHTSSHRLQAAISQMDEEFTAIKVELNDVKASARSNQEAERINWPTLHQRPAVDMVVSVSIAATDTNADRPSHTYCSQNVEWQCTTQT